MRRHTPAGQWHSARFQVTGLFGYTLCFAADGAVASGAPDVDAAPGQEEGIRPLRGVLERMEMMMSYTY
jgi:hypothetical protein